MKATNTKTLKLIKEIKTDWGRNVKYYELPFTKNVSNFMCLEVGKPCNIKVLKVIEMPSVFNDGKTNITEERFYGYMGNEYTTNLESNKYRRKFYTK